MAYLSLAGRQTREQVNVAVRTRDVYLGIRPSFEGGWVRENTPANFEVMAVDGGGKPLSLEGVSYRLVREVVNYHWYEVDGRWRYERQTRDYPITDGKIGYGPQTSRQLPGSHWSGVLIGSSFPTTRSGAQSSVRFLGLAGVAALVQTGQTVSR